MEESQTDGDTYAGRYSIREPESPFYCHTTIPKKTKLRIPNTTPAAYLQKCRALIPRLYWPKFEAGNEVRREDFYRRLCMLFIPWRDESALKGQFLYYQDRWDNFMTDLARRSPLAHADIQKIM